jgi:predicted  nucleic acid-binding Zn-ribbon protein
LNSEIQNYENKLTQVQANEDKDNQALSLTSAISTLNKSLQDIFNQVLGYQTRIVNVKTEQTPLVERVESLKVQINHTQNEQKLKLQPLSIEIKELDSQISEKNSTISHLEKQMEPIINSLGPLVYSTRPQSDALKPIYDRLDKNYNELETKNEENSLIRARLGLRDKNAIRNFFLTLAGVIIVVILIFVLLSAAL